MRTVILSLSLFLIGLRATSVADDMPWPRHVQPVFAQARKSIPAAREFLELYPNATMGFFDAADSFYLYLCVGLHGRYLVSLNIPGTLTADRRALKSWKEPYLEVEDVGEIRVAADDQGYTTEGGSTLKFGYDRFQTLHAHHGDFTSIGMHLSQDRPVKDFDRAWRPGHPEYVLRPSTFSPRKRYGVELPIAYFEGSADRDDRKNRVVEMGSGRVVSVLQSDPGYDRRLNWHETQPPRWSSDESILLWRVEGKWAPDALAVLKLKDGREEWQLNLLKTAQQAILSRTRKAALERYVATKKAHTGWGSAYRDGFTVDVTAGDEGEKTVSLPLSVQVDLTADPKHMIESPKVLESWLDGVVTKDGKFVVKHFQLGKRKGYEGR